MFSCVSLGVLGVRGPWTLLPLPLTYHLNNGRSGRRRVDPVGDVTRGSRSSYV